jgi:hypothetical protein
MGAASLPPPRCWSSHAKCPRVPMFKRAAIQAKGIVVLDRNSRANWTLRFEDQVKVVAHQAIRMHLPTGLLTDLSQRLQQSLPVLVVLEDGLPPVASIHHMIDCPRILNAHLSSHVPRLLLLSLWSQQNNTISIPLKNPPSLFESSGRSGRLQSD